MVPNIDRSAVVKAIKTFAWDNYGLDDVSMTLEDPDTQDWVNDLATEIVKAAS